MCSGQRLPKGLRQMWHRIVVSIAKAVGIVSTAMQIATKTRMASGMIKVTSNEKTPLAYLVSFTPVGDMGNVTFRSCKADDSSPRMALPKRFESIDTPDLGHLRFPLSVRAQSGCGFVGPNFAI